MRLIDADVMKEEIIDILEIEWGYEGIREDVSRIIDNMPTVDERPHGEWIDEGTYCSTMSEPIADLHSFKCPLCQNTFLEWTYNLKKHQFCSWCGAEMKKEVKRNE